MEDILIQYGVDLVVTLVVALLGVAGAWLAKVLAKKIELTNIAKATELVVNAATQTVRELDQTIVTDLKAAAKDGKLTQKEIADLGEKLLDMTASKLSTATVNLLESVKVDVAALITSAAEAYIAQMKGFGY